MKKVNIILVIFLLGMAGCGRESKQSTDDFITVDVTAKYPEKELILQDFPDVEYIPLETNDEFLTTAHIQAIGEDVMLFRNAIRRASNGDIFVFHRHCGLPLLCEERNNPANTRRLDCFTAFATTVSGFPYAMHKTIP
ncbi:MAG: 6-bladed beta-propeller, partial [Tannerellaceae bacterium]|nr:6-bladed beta-propeller [Tannerellaceae bacterium]